MNSISRKNHGEAVYIILAKIGVSRAQDRQFLVKARDAYARALSQSQTAYQRDQAVNAKAELDADLEAGRISQKEYDEASEAIEQALVIDDSRLANSNSIEELPDGKKYVRADRQVIFGNDPRSWREQLEDYINGRIRRGQNVELIGADGDVLTLTARTAGKIASMINSDGTVMSTDAYERKVNAGVHIDELAEVSTGGNKIVPDYDGRHGADASGGWNYRTAYFRDFDGKYYQCTISVEIGADGNAVYNIGQMKERSFPGVQNALNGSSAKGGAQMGRTSSNNSISQPNNSVNREYSVADSNADSLAPTDDPDIRYSISEPNGNFKRDKYYDRQIDKWDKLTADYVRVGEITNQSPIHSVGVPVGNLYFDVSKMKGEMESRNDPIPAEVMQQIPTLLDDPIVIAEYMPGKDSNTVNVYGNLEVYGVPVTVGIVVTRGRNGNVVNKIRTVHPRSYLKNQITDESVLYLKENKKETNAWFQARGNNVPLGGTQLGVIRSISFKHSISQPDDSVNRKYSVTETGSDADTEVKISAKAKPHFNRVRRNLYGRLGEVFNVPKFADRK